MKKEFYLNELKERKWVDFKNITNAIQNYIDIMDFLKVKDLDSLVKVQEKTLFKKKGNDLNKLNLDIELSKKNERFMENLEVIKRAIKNKAEGIQFLDNGLIKIA